MGPKVGWLHVGYKGGKFRDIDLLNPARRPLFEYLQHGRRDPESPYVFTSQRSERLTKAGVHHWFRILKQQANTCLPRITPTGRRSNPSLITFAGRSMMNGLYPYRPFTFDSTPFETPIPAFFRGHILSVCFSQIDTVTRC